jgi:hypothetical protein
MRSCNAPNSGVVDVDDVASSLPFHCDRRATVHKDRCQAAVKTITIDNKTRSRERSAFYLHGGVLDARLCDAVAIARHSRCRERTIEPKQAAIEIRSATIQNAKQRPPYKRRQRARCSTTAKTIASRRASSSMSSSMTMVQLSRRQRRLCGVSRCFRDRSRSPGVDADASTTTKVRAVSARYFGRHRRTVSLSPTGRKMYKLSKHLRR